MKLTFLGTGDAFTEELGHNSALLEFNNTRLCLDFPATNRRALKNLGLQLSDIEHVFLSHLHEDHINGIQQYAYFHSIVTKKKPHLYIAETLIDELWETVRSGLSKTTSGRKTIDDYFVIHPLKEKEPFFIGEQTFEIIKTDHVPEMDSYGLLAKPFFYFSCDSNVDEKLLNTVQNKVLTVFHDCHLWDLEIKSHASLIELKQLSGEIQSKIVLMHYHDGYAEEDKRKELEDKENIKLARRLQTFTF